MYNVCVENILADSLISLAKQVELRFLRYIKYLPAEFRFDPYIEVKGQTEVKVM